jgi:acetyltransferase-like isoleucine patch superfamily enzyme
MLSMDSVVLRIKRADTPLSKSARHIVKFCLSATIPVPRIAKPAGRLFYELRFYIPILWERLKSLLYTTPVFSCRCESVGKHLQLIALPTVSGHTSLYIGDDVRFSGNLSIDSGRFFDNPILRIGNRTFIGHNVSITCNREVIIEDDVLIAGDCRISDYDGHAISFQDRVCNVIPIDADIRPVRICKGAWIGSGALILKGVTIGTGAIVGANSVVTRNVPPYCVVAGSAAKVVRYIEPQQPTSFAHPVPAAA